MIRARYITQAVKRNQEQHCNKGLSPFKHTFYIFVFPESKKFREQQIYSYSGENFNDTRKIHCRE